jgi:hypothetical protein
MLAEAIAAIEDGKYDFCPAAYGPPAHRARSREPVNRDPPLPPKELPARELIEPTLPSLASDKRGRKGEPNKLTVATGCIMKALQVMGAMTIADMSLRRCKRR